jgi:hypothetical protein
LKLSKLPNVALRAGGRAAALRPHDLPEHRVVHVAAAVVPHGHPDVLRDLADVAQ